MIIYFCRTFLTYFLQYLVVQSKIYDKQMYIHFQISRGFESRWQAKLEKVGPVFEFFEGRFKFLSSQGV